MSVEQKIYDLRHQVTNDCNYRCCYCLNEGLAIGRRRGGLAPETQDLTLDQTIQLYGALFRALPGQIRCFAFTGGEPTLFGDKLIHLMQTVRQSGIQSWFLNSNASLITPEFADRLVQAGLREIKVNSPSMNSETHEKLTRRKLLQTQTKGVNACIARGMRVHFNIPLMRGINDRPEDLVLYVDFFRRATQPGQIQVKYLRLERGNYGDSRDKRFFNAHVMPTAELEKKLRGKFVRVEDFGRKKLYDVDVDGVTIQVAIIDNCSPEQMKDHPTKRTSFVITHDGKMRRMWDSTSYQFRFGVEAQDLDCQVQEALKFFEKI